MESTAYPELNRSPDGSERPCYGQEEMAAFVEHAGEWDITIIPELDAPGHGLHLLTQIPDIRCDTPGETTVFNLKPAFCLGKDRSYEVWDDLLDEVVSVFDADIVHVGADEWSHHGIKWKDCVDCRAYMESEGLDDGALEVVISESELDANARLAVLSRTDDGPGEHRLLFDAEDDRRSLHTLELADLDGDGLRTHDLDGTSVFTRAEQMAACCIGIQPATMEACPASRRARPRDCAGVTEVHRRPVFVPGDVHTFSGIANTRRRGTDSSPYYNPMRVTLRSRTRSPPGRGGRPRRSCARSRHRAPGCR